MYNGSITDVPGIRVGHATDRQARTGVTAVIAENGAVAGVDVRGGAPGTRETDAMAPGRLVDKINGVLLCGGSAYGLDAAGGAMRYFERRRQGYETGYARVPIVGAAVLFDLDVGSSDIRPDARMGALACACADKALAQGRVGAGCGATVGKLTPGATPAPGGIGSASMRLPGGATLGAIAAVNAAGDIYHPEDGALIACGTIDGVARPCAPEMFESGTASPFASNTTLSVLATDAALTREQAARLALCMHDGYARTIRPAHLPVDGDTAFALSTGSVEAHFVLLCAAASEVVARAVANAVLASRDGL